MNGSDLLQHFAGASVLSRCLLAFSCVCIAWLSHANLTTFKRFSGLRHCQPRCALSGKCQHCWLRRSWVHVYTTRFCLWMIHQIPMLHWSAELIEVPRSICTESSQIPHALRNKIAIWWDSHAEEWRGFMIFPGSIMLPILVVTNPSGTLTAWTYVLHYERLIFNIVQVTIRFCMFLDRSSKVTGLATQVSNTREHDYNVAAFSVARTSAHDNICYDCRIGSGTCRRVLSRI